MTDKEIIKALECCESEYVKDCGNCPYFEHSTPKCEGLMLKDALDLIKRQQATIETLRKCVERHHIIRKDGKSPLSLLTAEIRAEAIKEFAENIKLEFYKEFDEIIPSIMADKIDNLVKEMAGEDK